MNPLNRQWFYRGLRRRLVRVLGRTQAESVWENAGKEYQSMLSANAGLKKHKGAMVLPAVALYRALTASGADSEDLLNAYGDAREAQEAILPREKELFAGARIIGWTLMVFSILMILGTGVISVWDGFRSGFGFRQFFTRFVLIFTIYKVYDMVCFDYFLLMKFRFFQHYYPETESVYPVKKYGFNLKSQLLKLLVVFPAASALAAWVCSLFGQERGADHETEPEGI